MWRHTFQEAAEYFLYISEKCVLALAKRAFEQHSVHLHETGARELTDMAATAQIGGQNMSVLSMTESHSPKPQSRSVLARNTRHRASLTCGCAVARGWIPSCTRTIATAYNWERKSHSGAGSGVRASSHSACGHRRQR